jgi:hypothetical protein
MRFFSVRRVTTLVVALGVLLGLLAVPASAAGEISIFSRVESLGAIPIPDEDCAEIEGEGVLLGLAGGLAGAVAAGIARVASYCVDQVADRLFGEDDEGDEWSTRGFYESVASGFIGGFVGGLLAPYL